MKIDRKSIEKVLNQLNEAENRRPKVSVEETIAGIDAVMAPNVEGWHNGVHVPNREADRQGERVLFEMMPDYHRDFQRIIIDPPFVAFDWKIRGTMSGKVVEIIGCSIWEINAQGKVRRSWFYADTSNFTGQQ
jgi:predicted ester cyclase